MNIYQIDTLIQLSGGFTDLNGAPADPTTVTLLVRNPAGYEVTYSGSDITHVGTGSYSIQITPTLSGTWIYKWEGTGAVIATSADTPFYVEPSAFEGDGLPNPPPLGGSGGNASVPPLPFFGLKADTGWSRPALSAFSTWLNRDGLLLFIDTAVALGAGYAPGDISTLAGGTGIAATVTVTDTKLVLATIVSGGTSGTPGSAQVQGTTGTGNLFILDVTIGAGGDITSIDDINDPGDYTINPTVLTAEPVADLSASGITGATVHVHMGVSGGAIGTPGAYSVSPTSPVSEASSTGAGAGATWSADFSTLATATDNANGLPLIVKGSGTVFNSPYPNFKPNSYVQGLLKSRAAGPWTITMAMAAIGSSGTINDYPMFLPIILRNSANGKIIAIRWWMFGLDIAYYADSDPNTAPTVISNDKLGFPFPDYFAFFQVQLSGGNLTFRISQEGVEYTDLLMADGSYIEALAAHIGAVDQAGFGQDLTQSFAPLAQGSALWQWVET